ncbi:MAG: hypothetical protein J6R01_04975 [Alistipes sp.]|nr:hypothetical protein [Alistipes sp.]
MRRKNITTLLVMMLVAGAFLYAASGKMFVRYAVMPEPVAVATTSAKSVAQSKSSGDKRMVDMTADDSYLIDKGDSTIFILVGHFAAHHNGAVILADSAVRYSNQSFECFGNVLINQNSTYIYGERAEYNRKNNTAKVYSRIVKVVDKDAVMYTYNCKFNTAKSLGEFSGGCFVEKEDNLLEAERGFYNTKTHELKAINRVQMRNEDYEILSDSVIFNTRTEDAQYFTNTHIWNRNDEYLNTQAGTYTKKTDLHHLTRSCYLLQPEREIWSDSLLYYRTDGHIIARRNIQVDDTTQKILGFADYAEWWDEPGNALFTRRPSMINYDPEMTDSVYLSADTLWMYTIPVLPPQEQSDSTATDTEIAAESSVDATEDSEEFAPANKEEDKGRGNKRDQDKKNQAKDEGKKRDEASKDGKGGRKSGNDKRAEQKTEERAEAKPEQKAEPQQNERSEQTQPTLEQEATMEQEATDSMSMTDDIEEQVVDSLAQTDSIAPIDSLQSDSTKYTPKQLRRRAKMQRRAVRDSIKARERAIRDSLDSLKQIELDSIQHIRDSILKIKLDTLIAQRIERSSRLADQEKERIERIKIKAEMRRRQKIDKAKARALKRGKEYTGEDYDPNDTLFKDIVSPSRNSQMGQSDSLAGQRDSMQRDTTAAERPFPEDSVYKMIKAYRNVRMFRSESQMVCDSLVTLNTDSIIRMYQSPVMWNDNNQITSDSAMIHTVRQKISKAQFMGAPIMGIEIDTTYYNQVKGKEIIALFSNGQVYRNDVKGNAQTIYYLQDEGASDVTGLMYIESSEISFYLSDGEIERIVYKQNPEYVLYPMSMVPESQERMLQGFEWQNNRRPTRDSICSRRIRSTNRANIAKISKPKFPITERINYDRRRLTENRMWKDRRDRLTPDVIEWRNSRPSYKNRRR